MKIIDQYIYAIGQKLPMRGREDVKKELTSLLLDEIEEKYGENPSEEQINQAITDFGTPGKVAKRYSGDRLVISSGFTDLYFLIFKIMIFAMAVAFTTIFFVKLFTENMTGTMLLKEIGNIVLNTWNTSIAGIGVLTIIFIIITRFVKESQVDLEDDWTPKELKGIPLGEEAESKIESFISIFFLLLILSIINFFPQLLNFAEVSFEKSGMILGNRINLERFTIYAVLMSLVWITEIIYHILVLKIAVKTKALKTMQFITDIVAIIILGFMIADSSLFVTNPEATMPNFVGFKAIFILILCISSIELLVQVIKWGYKTLSGKM